MCYIMLYCIALCCIVLYYILLCCRLVLPILFDSIRFYSGLFSSPLHSLTVKHVILHEVVLGTFGFHTLWCVVCCSLNHFTYYSTLCFMPVMFHVFGMIALVDFFTIAQRMLFILYFMLFYGTSSTSCYTFGMLKH